MTKRIRAKYKIDRRLGQNIWGRPKSPLNKRESRPGQHGERRTEQAVRLRPAAARQAEAQGLLRQHRRAAVQRHLQGGAPLQGLDLRAPDRPAGAPARRHRLSRQVRADGVRRAPVRQPRPRHGERQARQRPELPLPRRRPGRGEGEGQADDAAARGHQERRARRARLHRGRPQQDDGQADARAGASATCPSRCTWSRTWWSSSTAGSVRPWSVVAFTGSLAVPESGEDSPGPPDRSQSVRGAISLAGMPANVLDFASAAPSRKTTSILALPGKPIDRLVL